MSGSFLYRIFLPLWVPRPSRLSRGLVFLHWPSTSFNHVAPHISRINHVLVPLKLILYLVSFVLAARIPLSLVCRVHMTVNKNCGWWENEKCQAGFDYRYICLQCHLHCLHMQVWSDHSLLDGYSDTVGVVGPFLCPCIVNRGAHSVISCWAEVSLWLSLCWWNVMNEWMLSVPLPWSSLAHWTRPSVDSWEYGHVIHESCSHIRIGDTQQ